MFQAKILEQFVVKYMNAAEVVLPWTENLPGKGSNTIEMSMDVNSRTQAVEAFIATANRSLKIYKYPMSKIPFSTLIEWATQISPSTGNIWLWIFLSTSFVALAWKSLVLS